MAEEFERESTPAPGWYANPAGAGKRYWDGGQWTDDYAEVEANSTGASVQRAPSDAVRVPARFDSLRIIAGIYTVLAWIVAIGGTIAVIAAAVSAANSNSNSDTDALVIVLGGALTIGFYVLLLFGISAAIRLALAVEENTRATAEEVMRLARE